ncbi:MAG: nicotinate (nicotinamide) nucleotide adenylyltransferase [Anaerolineales bacterium]|nr:nicotinate (nicotinamide) nucleotide adenylyltransferase [Anaerolineales bacterium]
MTQRIGLLGGTFDPPHIGHLWLGETAHDQLGLDEVWFLPVGQPPHKENRAVTAVSHRIAMTQLSIRPFPYFSLQRFDIDRPPPHTTISLLHCLQDSYPDTQFSLIIGADSLRDFATWDDAHQLIQRCRPAVLDRPRVTIDWQVLETAVPGIRAAVDWLDGPTVDISSTAIRQWARAGRSLKMLVKTAVLTYIQQHQLYNLGTK